MHTQKVVFTSVSRTPEELDVGLLRRQKTRSDNSQGGANRPLYTFRDAEVHRQPEKCKFKSVRFISHTPDWVKIQMLNYTLSVGKLEQAPISGGVQNTKILKKYVNFAHRNIILPSHIYLKYIAIACLEEK